MKARGIIFLFVLTGILFCLPTEKGRTEFYGSAPTGLLVLEKKHPYYLYVPTEYSPEKGWPLVVLLGSAGIEPQKVVDEWLDWAKKNQLFLLVATVFPREGSLPDNVDQWLVSIKREVLERYRVVPSQVLLVGIEYGAHYAAYLGLEFPNEFSATALFRRAWPGPFEKIMRTSSNRAEQIPFYVAMDSYDESFPAMEVKAAELERKGYQIVLDPLKKEEGLEGHRDRLIQWFLKNTDVRPGTPRNESKKGFKKTLREMRKNMFGI